MFCFFFEMCVRDGVNGMFFCSSNFKVKWGVLCLIFLMFLIFVVG